MKDGAAMLRGKVVLVTGAGRGIGRAIALAFARQGAHVVVHYGHSRLEAERTAEAIRSLGVQALLVQADLAHKAQIDRLYALVQTEFDRLDVLVNNAAIFSSAALGEVTEVLWDRILAINLKGLFFSCQAA
ncbi:MAG: SDR family NAD(P)-dependent oxidoreductase, partial [Chloroflexi bacterium]|nr:SDR family NAD(P)-dependent oxidoreductase [Chloroflexota bacterium]